ncbi:Intramembrane protease RasP/YluC, implicated in cell division based on FtsL cleavage [hydrothermal vent metagenome]|uniref:Intramembrane protease RasP/YluC, implicated in cell division based on FtsL cleavage n=1 Tax=hydrothermal vent metagenome TaxID=652676 RepID=A0A3B0TJN3_9ZZZZ
MFDFIYWLLSYILPFVGVLTIIVFVHEMGHYWVARWSGIAIHTFSIGFGPELIGRTDRLGTRWRLSLIPLGGYVRFVGDMNAASVPDPEAVKDIDPALRDRLFSQKSVWKRIAVVVAGPLANVLFTFIVLYGILLGYGRYVVDPVIDQVVANSPAATAGLAGGDRVVAVDGFKVRSFSDFQRLVSTSPERPVTIEVERNDQKMQFVLTPDPVEIVDRFGNNIRIGRIGVTRSIETGDYTLFRPSPIEAIAMTGEEVRFLVERTFAFLSDFFVGRGDVKQLGGPVKVAQVSGEVASLGFVALLNLTALLSLNIGIFNLFPIPLLDGGHLMYYLFEAIKGRPLSRKTQEIGFRIGLLLVGSLMLFTIFNDIF